MLMAELYSSMKYDRKTMEFELWVAMQLSKERLICCVVYSAGKDEPDEEMGDVYDRMIDNSLVSVDGSATWGMECDYKGSWYRAEWWAISRAEVQDSLIKTIVRNRKRKA